MDVPVNMMATKQIQMDIQQINQDNYGESKNFEELFGSFRFEKCIFGAQFFIEKCIFSAKVVGKMTVTDDVMAIPSRGTGFEHPR